MLVLVALVGIVSWRLRVPHAVALAAFGVVVAASGVSALPRLEPGLLLFVFLPPLLFDASFRLDERELRRLVPAVLVLAVPGVLLTTVVVGAIVALVLPIPLPAALLFGAMVAATDPVAVTAV